jgi:anti-sigma B factor antagonist
MPTLATEWNLEVERGPDGLWVRIAAPARRSLACPQLADALWSLLERHFVYRLVLDVEELDLSDDCTVNQLVDLLERITEHEGMLRLCGLSPANREAFEKRQLKGYIPCYHDREEAVMGGCPLKPR